MPGAVVAWASADSAVTIVNSSGLVTAVGTGMSTVMATAGSASGVVEVIVAQSPASVAITPQVGQVVVGAMLQLSAEAFDANGHSIAGTTFAWSTSDAAVATVDSTGLLQGVAEGTAVIAAAAGNAEGTADIVVGENSDRAVLAAIYEDTDGPDWANNENWLTDRPLHEWYGVATDQLGRVVALHLADNRLAGPIPQLLGHLEHLTYLSLWDNELTGPIPGEIGNLVNLEHLYMRGNRLTGPLPAELGNLTNLIDMRLDGNDLSGRIPSEFGDLANLTFLDLGGNVLSGPVPPELGDLASLAQLHLGWNDLSGAIPPELGNLASLTHLVLAFNNLSGPIPRSLPGLAALETFHFFGNADLCAPGTTGFVTWLEGIEETSGPYCNALDMGVLERLYQTSGGPDWTNSSGWLETPALEEWYGVSANSLGRVVTLDLTSNNLVGKLRADLGALADLTALRIGGNALSGRLPVSLADLPPLDELHYTGTGLCTPRELSSWIDGIPSHEGTGRECGPVTVRAVYALPSDREYLPRYRDGISNALRQLQAWYGEQLGGRTFHLHDTIPDRCDMPEGHDYYRHGGWPRVWDEVLAAVRRCADVRENSAEHVWLVFADVDERPGECDDPTVVKGLGRGARGLAMLSWWDLEGLSDPNFELCPYGVLGMGRWIGGVGHELGHAFGLPHPPGCEEGHEDCAEATRKYDALMWYGFHYWPNTYLLEPEKEYLRATPAFR